MLEKAVERPYPKHDAVVECYQAGIDLVAPIPCNQVGGDRFQLDIHTAEYVNGNRIVVEVDHRRGDCTENRLLRSRQIEGFHKSIKARGRFPFG